MTNQREGDRSATGPLPSPSELAGVTSSFESWKDSIRREKFAPLASPREPLAAPYERVLEKLVSLSELMQKVEEDGFDAYRRRVLEPESLDRVIASEDKRG